MPTGDDEDGEVDEDVKVMVLRWLMMTTVKMIGMVKLKTRLMMVKIVMGMMRMMGIVRPRMRKVNFQNSDCDCEVGENDGGEGEDVGAGGQWGSVLR